MSMSKWPVRSLSAWKNEVVATFIETIKVGDFTVVMD